MIKKLLPLLLLLYISLGFSQQAYYNGIDFTKSGVALKDDLAVLITNTHTNTLSYSDAREALKVTDLAPNQTTNVLLLYGFSNNICPNNTADDNDHRLRNKNSFGGGSSCEWNREHTFAKSLGNPNLGTSGPGADAHHLRACDVQRNSSRGSKKFANGNGNSGSVSGGWYPGDEWKGDVARMMMYMYLRYGNRCAPTLVGVGSSANTPDNMIDLFLQWNAEDPVSEYERARNTYLGNSNNNYGQGNRNPFIDEPYLATRIWGGPDAEDTWGIYTNTDNTAPTVPTNISVSNATSSTLDVSWTASTDNEAVTQYLIYVNGTYYASSVNTSTTLTGLTPNTTYSITVSAKDAAGNESAQSTPINATTTNGTNDANELFFSEYVEGSSNNKALEIANITSSPINLADYSIKRNGNGGSAWSAPLNLSGTIASGDAFVVIHYQANNQTLIDQADLVWGDSNNNGEPINFNGNDPVGLFKNDVLIDIIGIFNGGDANFAKDVTLRRKTSVTAPNTTFDEAGEWDSFPKDTVDDIGQFNSNLGVNNPSLTSFIMYPNPVKGNVLFFKVEKEGTLTIYSVLGKKILSTKISSTKNKIDLSKLDNGIYLVKVVLENQSITRKLVIK